MMEYHAAMKKIQKYIRYSKIVMVLWEKVTNGMYNLIPFKKNLQMHRRVWKAIFCIPKLQWFSLDGKIIGGFNFLFFLPTGP